MSAERDGGDPMLPRCHHQVMVDGLRLHVAEWGSADGVPLVMLHGIRGYLQTFERIAQGLPAHWRSIAFDQRGRGESDWDPQRRYDTHTYVEDLRAVVDSLGLARFHLLGHSMGGINAIVFASRHPDRVASLLVEDAGPGAFEHSAGAQRIQRELRDTPSGFDDWAAAVAFMRALRPTVTEEAREQRLRSMLRPRSGGGFTWRYDHAGIAATRLDPDPARVVDLMPHVRALQCPTLVVRGGRSDYLQPTMAQAMCDANPRIRWTEIADAGHYIHDDQPEMFQRALEAFLEQVAPTQGAPS